MRLTARIQNYMNNNRDLIGIFVAIGSALIFGLYPPATRAAYAQGANGVFIILFTTIFRTASLSLFCMASKRKLFAHKSCLKTAMQNGFFQTASTMGILGGMAFLPGPVVMTIIFSYTLLLYFYLVFKKEERLNFTTLLSVIAAFIGLSLVVGAQDKFVNLSLMGLGLAGMAALASASRMYRYGQLLKNADPVIIGAETFIFVLIFSCFLMAYKLPILPISLQGWLWTGLAAFALSLGNFGMFYGIKLLGSFKFSFFVKLEPVFGAIFSIVLIGEMLTASQYLGIGVVVASLCFYQVLQVRPRAKADVVLANEA